MSSAAVRAFVIAWCVLLPSLASAGNDNEMLMGNRAAMTAAAVVSNVSDPSSTWYNPAGLGAIDRQQFDVSGTAYTMRFFSAEDFISTVDGSSADASVTEFVSIPTQIAYVRNLSKDVVLGLGYFVPNTQNLILREQVDAGGQANGSTWQLSMATASTLHTAAAALGMALSPRVRFGFALVGSYEAGTQSLTFFGTVRRGGANYSVISTSLLATASQVGFEADAGAQLELGEHVELGVNVRGPRVLVHQSSDVAGADTGALVDPVDGSGLYAEATMLESSKGLALARTGHATLGLTYRYRTGWVSAEADLEPGLHDEDSAVDRHLLVNARAGVYQTLSEHVALGFGVFSDRTPRSRKVEPGEAEGDFYGATAGIELGNKHMLAEAEDTDSLIFSTVFALRYAYSAATVGRIVADPDDFGNPLIPERGRLTAHELGLFVGSGLQF
jgi:hypothetical protein